MGAAPELGTEVLFVQCTLCHRQEFNAFVATKARPSPAPCTFCGRRFGEAGPLLFVGCPDCFVVTCAECGAKAAASAAGSAA